MPQFKNPPVREVVFEVRFPAELSIECKKDEFYEKIRKIFPSIFIPKTIATEAYAVEPYQFKNLGGTKIIRFSINQYAFITKQYESYKVFKQECLEYMNLFFKIYNITRFKRIGLRYINHIPISHDDKGIPIAKYLNFGYKLPKVIPNEFSLFSSMFVTKLGSGKLRTVVQYEPHLEKIIVLDFDYFLERDLVANKLQKYLEDSHRYTEKVFLSIITDKYRKIIEGDK
ncbi:TIGR04255 family protein [bacterium]|nr:TIGR04255 family protein [bacterium]